MPNFFYAPLLLPLSVFRQLYVLSLWGPLNLSMSFARNVSGCASVAGMLSNARGMCRWEASASVLEGGGSVSKVVFAIVG